MIQTRSEETGLREFNSLAEAMAHASKDKTVWKVSFTLNNERVRLVRRNEVSSQFVYEPM